MKNKKAKKMHAKMDVSLGNFYRLSLKSVSCYL